jgi:hypothetical protein
VTMHTFPVYCYDETSAPRTPAIAWHGFLPETDFDFHLS